MQPARPRLSPLTGFDLESHRSVLDQQLAAVGADGLELVFAPAPSDRARVFGSCRLQERQLLLYPNTISRFARSEAEAVAIARGVARHEALHAVLSAQVRPAERALLRELDRVAPGEIEAFQRLRNVLEDGYIEQTDAACDPDGHRAIAVAYALIRDRSPSEAVQTPMLQTVRALAQLVRPSGDQGHDNPRRRDAEPLLELALAGCAADPEGRAVAAWRCLDLLRARGLADDHGTVGHPRLLPGNLGQVQLAPAAPLQHQPASPAEVAAAVQALTVARPAAAVELPLAI